MSDTRHVIERTGGVLKDVSIAIREMVVGFVVAGVAIWVLFGSTAADWQRIGVGPSGLTLERAAAKEATRSANEAAKEVEKIKDDVITLQSRIEGIGDKLAIYRATPSEDNLNRLTEAVTGTKSVATASVRQAEQASVDTARNLRRVDELASTLEQTTAIRPQATAGFTGWYYLGKISRDRTTWLPSSAMGSLTFSPPLGNGGDLLAKIQRGKTEVMSSGYKYVRSLESQSGRRVDGAITRTLPPNVSVRILELDDKGTDRADGETVVWARVEVPNSATRSSSRTP